MSESQLTIALWFGGIVASACAAGIGILLTNVRAQGKQLADNTIETTKVRVALVGYDGQNGLVSDVRALKKRVHDLADVVTPLVIDHEQRVEQRRSGLDRRKDSA